VRRSEPPYAGVKISTLGELLWILCERGWAGGLTPERVSYSDAASWFTKRYLRTNAVPDLRGVDMNWVNLMRCDLKGANLQGANLKSCDLRYADVREANFTAANLEDALLEGALTTEAHFTRATLLNSNRAKILLEGAKANEDKGNPPWTNIAITTRNEWLWIMREWKWSGEVDTHGFLRADYREALLTQLDFTGIDAIGADFSNAKVIAPEREAVIAQRAQSKSQMPYADFEIESSGELLWILATNHWSGDLILGKAKIKTKHKARRNPKQAQLRGVRFSARGKFRGMYLQGANLSNAILDSADCFCARLVDASLNDASCQKTNLSRADLTGTIARRVRLDGAQLGETRLVKARLENANFDEAYAQRADFLGALLQHASFKANANLKDTILSSANADGTDFSYAQLQGATLRGLVVTGATNLEGCVLDTRTVMGGVNWNSGVSLIAIDWSNAPTLGDEILIESIRERFPTDRLKLLEAYRTASRAYHGLSAALDTQRMSAARSRYRLREQRLQRVILRLEGNYPGWIFSWLLDIVAGYGERPGKTLFIYLTVISLWATLDYGLALVYGPHSFCWVDFLAFSIASFHGRGFFPASAAQIPIYSPITRLAEVEAALGLFIELTFIASFTRRLLD